MKYISIVLLLLLSAAVGTTTSVLAAAPSSSYIVVLHEDTDSPSAVAYEIASQAGGRVGFVYSHALKGFSVTLPAQAVESIKKNPKVNYITTDDIRHISDQTIPTGVRRIFADSNTNIGVNGLDDFRVDVDVAVIDTGIDYQHEDLNVVGGVNCVSKNPFKAKCLAGGDDDHYHGTHVAGIIGALDNGFGVVGVAPGARLWVVKVLNSNGSGYDSWILAGIDWVVQQGNIEVINMSLGGKGVNPAYETAINNAVASGIVVVVAAGNESDDASLYTPAFVEKAITVSALEDLDGMQGDLTNESSWDTLAWFSNFGSVVDVIAPGAYIYSTIPMDYNYLTYGGYASLSGTSMAAPHVAGAVALLASMSPPADETDVGILSNEVVINGNYIWVDTSADGFQEPLLDVANFSANLIEVSIPNDPDAGTGGDIILSSVTSKLRGAMLVELAWSGVTSSMVDIYREGNIIASYPAGTNGSGTYADSPGKGGGTFQYQVCEEGTNICSNTETVVF